MTWRKSRSFRFTALQVLTASLRTPLMKSVFHSWVFAILQVLTVNDHQTSFWNKICKTWLIWHPNWLLFCKSQKRQKHSQKQTVSILQRNKVLRGFRKMEMWTTSIWHLISFVEQNILKHAITRNVYLKQERTFPLIEHNNYHLDFLPPDAQIKLITFLE